MNFLKLIFVIVQICRNKEYKNIDKLCHNFNHKEIFINVYISMWKRKLLFKDS